MLEHRKLVAMIESGRHLLVGAKALATYMEQRFTQDTDYVVEHRLFLKLRKWLREEKIDHVERGLVVQCEQIGIDIIDASSNAVLKEILKHEAGVPSPEGLAATKYIAIVSGTRGQRKMYQDIADLVGLVGLPGFDMDKFLGYFVGEYEEQRTHVAEAIEKIRRGEFPITI